MPKQKTITILGVGGHGSSAYRDFVTNPKYQDYKINLVLGADDCGGHTGEIQEVLPTIPTFNRDPDSVIPMGDLRSILERMVFDMEPNNEWAKAKLDAISGSYVGQNSNDFINRCFQFCRDFDIQDDEVIQEFIRFCQLYFQAYKDLDQVKIHNGENGFKHKHKIGNLFLTFLHQYCQQNEKVFFEILKHLGFLPTRVFPHFIYNQRLDLQGENLDLGMRFTSEAEIDEAKVPISPATYQLLKNGVEEPLTIEEVQEHNPEVMNALQEADLIVYSTGSIANLFGQLNLLSPALKDNPALKVWLGNIATTNNEVNFTVLMTYYFSPQRLGLDGVVLQMSESEFDNLTIDAQDSTWVERYRKQGKNFVNIPNLIANVAQVFNYNGLAKTVNLVQPVLGITVAESEIAQRIPGWDSLRYEDREMYKSLLERGGIKYVTTDITSFIRFFYELNNYLCNELKIGDRSYRYQIVAEILKRLNLSEKEDPCAEIDFYTETLAIEVNSNQELKHKTEILFEAMGGFNQTQDFSELSRVLQETIPAETEIGLTVK